MFKLEVIEGSTATTILVRHQVQRGARWSTIKIINAPTPHLAFVELGKWAQEQIEIRDHMTKTLTRR